MTTGFDNLIAEQHSSTLWSAYWANNTWRTSCMHLHRTRTQAEACAAQINAAIGRILTGGQVGTVDHLAHRLAQQPDTHYEGVHQETIR